VPRGGCDTEVQHEKSFAGSTDWPLRDQQAAHRYECYTWAVKASRFDPSQEAGAALPGLAQHGTQFSRADIPFVRDADMTLVPITLGFRF